jgi:hypothetical protein
MCLRTRAFTRDEARRIADNVGKLPSAGAARERADMTN